MQHNHDNDCALRADLHELFRVMKEEDMRQKGVVESQHEIVNSEIEVVKNTCALILAELNNDLVPFGFELEHTEVRITGVGSHTTANWRNTSGFWEKLKADIQSIFNKTTQAQSELVKLNGELAQEHQRYAEIAKKHQHIRALIAMPGLLASWWFLKCTDETVIPTDAKYSFMHICRKIYRREAIDDSLIDSVVATDQVVLSPYFIAEVSQSKINYKEERLLQTLVWAWLDTDEGNVNLEITNIFADVKNDLIACAQMPRTMDGLAMKSFAVLAPRQDTMIDVGKKEFELLQPIPAFQTHVHEVSGWYTFMASESKQTYDVPSEDVLFWCGYEQEMLAIVCDGVSQSSFGDEAARQVKQALFRLWIKWRSTPLAGDLESAIKDHLVVPAMKFAQKMTHHIVEQRITEIQDTLMKDIIQDTFQSSGSQTTWSMVFTQGSSLVCVWMGNSRIMVKSNNAPTELIASNDPRFDNDKIRFSSHRALTPNHLGMRGDVFIAIYDIQRVDDLHIFIHSDALESAHKKLYAETQLPENVLFECVGIDDLSLVQLHLKLIEQ
jgi:hypothetical protein